jgi:hypothetical protein
MFLRCGEEMLIAHNTIVAIEGFAFAIGRDSGAYSGAIDGLRITNNIIDNTATGAKIFGIETALPGSVRINSDLVRTSGKIATFYDGRSTTSLAEFSAWTGFENAGFVDDPRFIDPGNRDYRLRAGSPAIDRGIVLPGISDSYWGSGPDLGRYERTE